MKSSPLRTEFFAENSSIDNGDHMITTFPRGDACNWHSSSSFTALSPKMRSCKSHAELSTTSAYGSLNQSKIEKLTLACRSSSKELQRSLSISSDSSVPEMMEDHPGLSTSESEISLEDFFRADSLDTEAALWNFWFSPEQQDLSLGSPFLEDSTAHSPSILPTLSPTRNYLPPIRSPLHLQDSNLSPYNRNFASTNLFSLHISPESSNVTPQSGANHQDSEAIRTPRQTPQHLSIPLPTSTYSPFPPCNTTTTSPPPNRPLPNPLQSYQHPASELRPKPQEHATHISSQDGWPPRVESRLSRRVQQQPTQHQAQVQQAQTRARAYTTPSRPPLLPPHIRHSSKQPRSPQTITSNSSHLYMRSAPNSPNNPQNAPNSATKTYLELMDLMSQEKSFFETDDADDEEKSGFMNLLEGKFHIRSHSGSEKEMSGGLGVGDGEKKRSLRVKAKSAGEAIKGVFGIRRSIG
ncbi:hypothetical protein B0J14DRAFT_560487 [Halenospora varia]|nr:hypothetical protein B0J14DRAFT_560487 [Halenospora varia]